MRDESIDESRLYCEKCGEYWTHCRCEPKFEMDWSDLEDAARAIYEQERVS